MSSFSRCRAWSNKRSEFCMFDCWLFRWSKRVRKSTNERISSASCVDNFYFFSDWMFCQFFISFFKIFLFYKFRKKYTFKSKSVASKSHNHIFDFVFFLKSFNSFWNVFTSAQLKRFCLVCDQKIDLFAKSLKIFSFWARRWRVDRS